jgi:STE24 endopeptidase
MSEMTATRISFPRVATLVVVAGVWSAAAYLLWDSTTVPGDLSRPHLGVSRFFSPHLLHRTADYAAFGRWDWVLSEAALLVTFALYARYGVRFMRESAAGRVGTGMLLGMLGFAILWLVQIPFRLADFWWERRHHVAHGGYVAYVLADWLQLGGIFVSLSLTLAIVMGLAGLLGKRWWILGGPVFVAMAALFIFVSPYLTSLHRVHDPVLAAQAKAIAGSEGVGDVPLRVQDVGKRTDEVNAYSFGLGPSRRVVLWSTFLDGRFPSSDLRFVIAHEYGHQAHRHLWKGLAWYALFAFPGAYLIERATRRRGGMRAPEAVPLSLLVLVVLNLAALPLQNLISRHFEAEADWSALRTTRDPAAGRDLFEKFATTSLAEPSPPTWDFVLLEDHPTLIQRIEMVEAWQARTRRG